MSKLIAPIFLKWNVPFEGCWSVLFIGQKLLGSLSISCHFLGVHIWMSECLHCSFVQDAGGDPFLSFLLVSLDVFYWPAAARSWCWIGFAVTESPQTDLKGVSDWLPLFVHTHMGLLGAWAWRPFLAKAIKSLKEEYCVSSVTAHDSCPSWMRAACWDEDVQCMEWQTHCKLELQGWQLFFSFIICIYSENDCKYLAPD